MVTIINDITNLVNVTKGEVIIDDNINSINDICDAIENLSNKVIIKKISKEDEIKKELNKRHTYQGFNNSILNKVRQICILNIKDNDYVVDMTIGNGNDTLFLSKLVPNGKVIGFDIQQEAIINTTKLLKSNNITNYILYKESHENIILKKEYRGKIKLILFNLGYMPKGDKSIMTHPDSTLKAVINGMNLLTKGGIILIVCYPHPEGVKEAKVIRDYLKLKHIKYNEYHNTLKEYAPFLIEIK